MWHETSSLYRPRAAIPHGRGHAMSENGTVMVTGSSRGIGRAIALRLARDGYDIVVHCRSRIADAESVAAEVLSFGRFARRLQFDVATATSAQRGSPRTSRRTAPTTASCATRARARHGVAAMSGDAWDSVIRTNLDAFYNVCSRS